MLGFMEEPTGINHLQRLPQETTRGPQWPSG